MGKMRQQFPSNQIFIPSLFWHGFSARYLRKGRWQPSWCNQALASSLKRWSMSSSFPFREGKAILDYYKIGHVVFSHIMHKENITECLFILQPSDTHRVEYFMYNTITYISMRMCGLHNKYLFKVFCRNCWKFTITVIQQNCQRSHCSSQTGEQSDTGIL